MSSKLEHRLTGTPAYKCSVVNEQEIKNEFDHVVKNKLKHLTGSDRTEDFSSIAKVLQNGFTIFSMACTKVKKQNSYTVMLECSEDQAEVIEIKQFVMHKRTRTVFAIGRLMARIASVLDRRVLHLQQLSYLR